MNEPALDGATDAALIDDALAVIRDARQQAPSDFMFSLAIVLGCLGVGLLAMGWLVDGAAQDILIGLGCEVLGAWLTVVLIDGLWKRLEAGASDSLDRMAGRLEQRKGDAMSDAEREAWREFVDGYRATLASPSRLERMRTVPSFRHRLDALEARGNRTLAEFPRAAADAPWPGSAADESN